MNVRSMLMVTMIVGCGPQSGGGAEGEGGSSSTGTTEPDDTTPTGPQDDPTPCTFCEEIEMICLSETMIDPWLCARMRKWACIDHVDTACDDMVNLCMHDEPPCDGPKVQLLCDAAHEGCLLESVPSDSTTEGPQGSGEGGGERGESTDGSSTSIGDDATTGDTSTMSTSTGDMRTTIEV